MTRAKACPVKPAECGSVERQLMRKERDRDAMAGRTEDFSVTGIAEVSAMGCACSMIADEIGTVDDMALGTNALALEIHVASLAGAEVEVSLMLVTLKTRGHRWEEGALVASHVVMASHALAMYDGQVDVVRKSEVLPCGRRALVGVRHSVAFSARVRVVGRAVALETSLVRREMNPILVSGSSNVLVADGAGHAAQDMSSMLEGSARRFEAEEMCTR